MPNIYATRQQDKALRDRYRERAAAQLGVKPEPNANVHLMADGAFVEVNIWIPKEEPAPRGQPCPLGDDPEIWW